MKKIFLTTAGLSLLSLPAMAVKPEFFIGGNFSGTTLSYTEEAEEIMEELVYSVPDYFHTLGVEAGVKVSLADDEEFSIGWTLAYDYAFDQDGVVRYPYNELYSDASIGFSSISATTDLYYNLKMPDKDTGFLMFGIGYASVTERIDLTATSLAISNGLYSVSEDTREDAMVFKIGFGGNLAKTNLSFLTTLRYFMPTDNTDIDGAFLWNLGIRYTF